MRRRIEATDALILASPEYNGSMAGLVKNAVDWVSRFRPQPFSGRHAMLVSASPSMVGGNRGLWSLRVPLEHLGAHVFADMFSLAQAHDGFDDDGQITHTSLKDRFDMTLVSFMDLVEAAKHYPCAKQRWIEFLGEPPTPLRSGWSSAAESFRRVAALLRTRPPRSHRQRTAARSRPPGTSQPPDVR